MPWSIPHRVPPWPAPALLTWLGAWWLLNGLRAVGAAPALALALASAAACAAAALLPLASRWRRGITALGFPLSALVSGSAANAASTALPAWVWLLPLGLLLLAYPLKAWRDAPLFPSPRAALAGASALLALPPGARLLDAGCGLGHGLAALRTEFPQARIDGIEWSWPLRLAAGLRCRWAGVRQGDMWAADWSPYALVYVFQRPESMARAWAKAQAELARGSWLVSLDFAVPGVSPAAVLRPDGAQPLWLYQVGGAPTAGGQGAMPQPAPMPADKSSKRSAHRGSR